MASSPATTENPRIDALIRQRIAENPPDRDCSACQSCGRPTTRADLWRAQWSYYFIPKPSVTMLLMMLGAALLHVHLHFTREARHNTFHVICESCVLGIRRGRVWSAILQFLGLFLMGVGLVATMGSGAWWAVANRQDRGQPAEWFAVAVGAMIIGFLVLRVARRLSLPGVVLALKTRKFQSTAFVRAVPPESGAAGKPGVPGGPGSSGGH